MTTELPTTCGAAGRSSEIVRLEAENVMLKNCNGQLNTMLDAWYSAFGTNQLTHALARLKAAEKCAAKSKNQAHGSTPVPDPYEAYFEWCKANGFRDVAECEPEDVNVARMDESIAAYGKAQNADLRHGSEPLPPRTGSGTGQK